MARPLLMQLSGICKYTDDALDPEGAVFSVYMFVFADIYLVIFLQAARDAEMEKELRQRHPSVQRDLPRPSEVRKYTHPIHTY